MKTSRPMRRGLWAVLVWPLLLIVSLNGSAVAAESTPLALESSPVEKWIKQRPSDEVAKLTGIDHYEILYSAKRGSAAFAVTRAKGVDRDGNVIVDMEVSPRGASLRLFSRPNSSGRRLLEEVRVDAKGRGLSGASKKPVGRWAGLFLKELAPEKVEKKTRSTEHVGSLSELDECEECGSIASDEHLRCQILCGIEPICNLACYGKHVVDSWDCPACGLSGGSPWAYPNVLCCEWEGIEWQSDCTWKKPSLRYQCP